MAARGFALNGAIVPIAARGDYWYHHAEWQPCAFEFQPTALLVRMSNGKLITMPYATIDELARPTPAWQGIGPDRIVSVLHRAASEEPVLSLVRLEVREAREFLVELGSRIFGGRRLQMRYPTLRGGVMVAGARWEPATVTIGDKRLDLSRSDDPTQVVRIPFDQVLSLDHGGPGHGPGNHTTLSVEHRVEGEVFVTDISLPGGLSITALRILKRYVREIESPPIDNERDQRVAELLYLHGLDRMSLLQLSHMSDEQLEAAYDRILEHGLARVTRVQRQLELTPRGQQWIRRLVEGRFD